MHENDYAYNPDLESELSSNRSVLRTVLLLYNGEVHSSEMVNSIVEKWERKHSSINSIVGVSVTGVSDKPQSNLSADCPNCFCGNIFYDANDGIVDGQQPIFESIAKCVFSPNEFDDDEINMAIDAYDEKHLGNGHSNSGRGAVPLK